MNIIALRKKITKKCNTINERSIKINQKEVTQLHAMKAFRLSRKHKTLYKILMVILLMVGLGGMINSQASVVQASDGPKNMLDVAKHFGSIGGDYVANTSKYGKYINTPWKAWNYLGPGSGSILTSATKGSKTATYSALNEAADSGNNSFSAAAHFQQALLNTGLDHANVGGPTGISNFGRILAGLLVMLVMYVTVFAGGLINIALEFFEFINPFVGLQYLVTDSSKAVDGATNIQQSSIWKPIVTYLRPFYTSMSDMTVSIAYLLLCIGILAAFTNMRWGDGIQSGSLGKRLVGALLKYMRRVIIVVAGPLLIAIVATNMMETFKNNTEGFSQTLALKSVWSNYVDFEGWVKHSRLGLPSVGKDSATAPLNESGTNYLSNNYIYQINTDGAANSTALKVKKATISIKTDGTKGNSKSGKSASSFGSIFEDANQTANFVMNTWAGGATIKGTDYDSEILSTLRPMGQKKNNQKGSTQASKAGDKDFEKAGKNSNWLAKGWYGLKGAGEKIGAFGAGLADKINNTDTDYSKQPYGILSLDNWEDKNAYDNIIANNGSLTYSNGSYQTDAPSAKVHAPELGTKSGHNGGLSTLGMYNYLNSLTDNTGLTYTQPNSFVAFGGGVNEHRSAGFSGRGMLAVGNYFKMIATMTSIALLLIFVAWIIILGATSSIPRMLVYAVNLVAGRWRGLLGIFKELVGMYARILVGSLIISVFTEIAENIDDQFESFLTHGFDFSTVVLGNKYMPFMTSTFLMGLIKFFSGVLLLAIAGLCVKNFFNVISFINTMFKELTDKLGKFSVFDGSKDLGIPPQNSNANIHNAGNRNDDMSNNNGKNDNYNSLNPENNGENIDKARQDPSLHDDNKDFPNGLKAGLAKKGLADLDKLDKSKTGQLAKKGASAMLGALAGSKLGKRMGLHSRGQGQQLPEKMEKGLRKLLASKANPKHVNNSERAGMTQAQQKAYDKKHAHDLMTAPDKALAKDAQKQAQKLKEAQPYMDKFGENGQAKDKKAASQMDQAMQEMAEKGLGNQKLDQANENRNKMAKQAAKNAFAKQENGKTFNQERAEKKLDQAKENRAKAAKELQSAKQDAQAYPQDSQVQKQLKQAQKRYDKANSNVAKAQDQANKARIMGNAGLRSKAINGSQRALGVHGENLEHVTPEQMQATRNRRFTAMTGKAAPQNAQAKATNAQKQQALQDKVKAEKVLSNPASSQAQKEQARKQIHDANVALQTGYQYGKYGDSAITSSYQDATSSQLAQANANKDMDEFTTRTGYGVSKSAQAVDPAMKAYSERMGTAEDIVSSGQIVDSQTGQMRNASEEEIGQAQREIAADPAHQVSLIRNNMAQIGEQALTGATQAADEAVSKAPDSATAQELNKIRSQAMDNYMSQPEVAKQLSAAGFSTGSVEEIHQVQHAAELNRTALKSSLAPYRQQAETGMIVSNPQTIVNSASQSYDNMQVAPELVTSDAYGKTTNKQWMKSANMLVQAYNTGSQTQINKAQAIATQNGLPAHIVNDGNKLLDAVSKVRNEKQSVIQNAVSYAQNNTTTALADIEQYRTAQS